MILNKPSTTKVNILGTEYTVIVEKENKHFGVADGYCDENKKEIHIQLQDGKDYEVADIKHYLKTVVRHEIIHAFLFESGHHGNSLVYEHSWEGNEEMIDWWAIQFHKIEKVFKELKI